MSDATDNRFDREKQEQPSSKEQVIERLQRSLDSTNAIDNPDITISRGGVELILSALRAPSEPPVALKPSEAASIEKAFARSPRRVADLQPSATLPECPYCKRPADSEGGIFHATGCEGLEDAGITMLQLYTMMQSRPAQPPEPALRDALVHAVSVIQTWHNMDIPEKERSGLWDIYWRNAPEMKPIRAALTKLPDSQS